MRALPRPSSPLTARARQSSRNDGALVDAVSSEPPDEDRVVRPSSLQTPAHAVRLDEKAVIPQPVLELHVVSRRPDRVDAVLAEGRSCVGEARVAVESAVAGLGERRRAVVDVEEGGVEAMGAIAEGGRDVTELDPYAAVPERMAGELAEVLLVPFDDGGEQLGDDDRRAAREKVEGRAE